MFGLGTQERKLRSLQREIRSLAMARELDSTEQRLARLRDESLYRPPVIQRRVQESITTTLFGNPSLRALSGYISLVEVPAMIREQFPYKQAVIRTIVQLDFVRWVGRILYEDCPTFSTAINAIKAMVLGSGGLTVQAYSKEKDANEDLVEEVNELICAADEYNDFAAWQEECLIRYHKDGEAFLRVNAPKRSIDDDPPEIACIEPDFIRPSVVKGQTHEDPNVSSGMNGSGQDWSFGIHNDPYRWHRPKKYQICWPPEWSREEQVDADDMFHLAYREHRNMKRGVPTCFKIVDDIVRVTLHREADGVGAVQRAKIAGVVEYETNIDQTYVQTDLEMLAANADKPNLANDPTVSPYYLYPLDSDQQCEFVGLLPGRRFVMPPTIDAAASKEIYERGIMTIASYYGLPGSVFGLATDASFASALVEESMPARLREREQGMHCAFWQRVIKRIVELSYPGDAKGLWEKIGIKVSGPSMVVRDIATETAAHVDRINAKLESRRTAQMELGLDPEEEITNMEAEEAIDVLQPDVMAGEDGSLPPLPETADGARQQAEGEDPYE